MKPCVVVYADDDDLVRTTVAALLADEGMEVHACSTGTEALALCETIAVDAALLDLNMPDVTGFDVAQRLRRGDRGAFLRIVALTGRGTWDMRRQAMDAGFDEFLVKPVPAARLAAVLRGGPLDN